MRSAGNKYLALVYFILIIPMEFYIPVASAQHYDRDEYFDYMPPTPRIISQTKASSFFHLYGNKTDTGYVDRSPVNGIDDNREKWLKLLAAKFSPLLKRNTFNVPSDFEKLLKINYDKRDNKLTYDVSALMHIDRWELVRPSAKRIFYDSVMLGILPPDSTGLNSKFRFKEAVIEDEKLLRYIREFHPDSVSGRKVEAESEISTVIFFDFPGEGEKSWKSIYSKQAIRNSKIYSHFFIHLNSESNEEGEYEFVIQYWFFFPYNDGPNDHEGDWEHINVIITTKDLKAKKMTESDMNQLLRSSNLENTKYTDSLIIKRVDYYFHKYVMTLDYQELDYLIESSKGKEYDLEEAINRVDINDNFLKGRRGYKDIYNQIYERIHIADGEINTHPIAFIGANNIGWDQLLKKPGDKNRNSHGIYPFPGIWKNIGSLGVTESIQGRWDQKFIKKNNNKNSYRGALVLKERYVPEKDRDKYIMYGQEDINILPDWERILDLVLNDREVRRAWSWMVLPVWFGYPVVESPIGGALEHTDLGNVAAIGPTYNSAWNRLGPTKGFKDYNPHVLPHQYQTSITDNFINSWGVFNASLPLWVSVPGLKWMNAPFRLIASKKKDKVFYPKEEAPFRYSTRLYQPTYTFVDDNYARLLPFRDNPTIKSYLDSLSINDIDRVQFNSGNKITYFRYVDDRHIGRRWTSETIYSYSRNDLSYSIFDPIKEVNHKISGELEFVSLSGLLRRNLMNGPFQPYIGYGWSWNYYRPINVKFDNNNCDGVCAENAESWVIPSILIVPNSQSATVGFELFFSNLEPDISFLGRLTRFPTRYLGGLRFEYTVNINRVRVSSGRNQDNPWVYNHQIGLGFFYTKR